MKKILAIVQIIMSVCWLRCIYILIIPLTEPAPETVGAMFIAASVLCILPHHVSS
jgi:hypothetical protein